MDACQCTSLIARFKALPDPRCARGVRYPWWVLLTLVTAAMLADCNHYRAIAEWAHAHQSRLRRRLPLFRGQAPSVKTFQRAMRLVDPEALLALVVAHLTADHAPAALEAIAVDGKTLRGASGPTRTVHLLAAARHSDGALLGQAPVGAKANEITVAPQVLADLDLTGKVVTADAMLCQRALCQQINAAGGDWLFALKGNHAQVRDEVQLVFGSSRRGPHKLHFAACGTLGKAHGRLERRHLEATAALAGQLAWPGLQQVIKRHTWACVGGAEREQTSYWLTSLTPAQATPHQLEQLCRGHWSIENSLHWVRDETFREDRSTVRCGTAPVALALVRSLAAWLLRRAGWPCLSQARRHYTHHPLKALRVLGCL
jgi:predicted transposase YbfD/YdcC